MPLNAVFKWIYCLDFHEVLVLLAFFTGLFCIVCGKFSQYRFWKPIIIAMLIIWAYIVLVQTILWRTPDTTLKPVLMPFQSYIDALKEDGQKELLRSNFMNVVLFYPAGLLAESILPVEWKHVTRLLVVLTVFTIFSTAIEYIQYCYNLGLAQTDDVIHNALGALIGAVVTPIITVVFKNKQCKNPQR